MPSRLPPDRDGCVSCRSSAGEPSGGGWRCSSTSWCSAARCSCAGAPAPGRKYDSEAHAPAPPLMLVTLKTLLHTVLLPPGGPLLVAGAGAWLARSGVTARARRAGWLLLAASLVVSWLLARPVVADWLARAAERSPPLDLTRPVAAQALVILGGGDERVAAPEYGGAPAPGPLLLERVAYGAFVAHRTALPVLVSGTAQEALAMRRALARDFGVEGFVAPAPDWSEFLLQVDVAQAELAVRHLAQYEAENRAPLPLPPPPSLYPHAWIGCAAYVLVLLGVAWVLSNGLVRLDAFDQGVLDAARVQGGEWWRAWTALTLHLDGPHLAANLGAGVWFGYLAGRQMGVGTAWLLTVTGAALANLLEGLTGPPEHQAAGASTAVFAALGAMSAHSWRERLQLPQRWARRWGPLVAGVILLGWTGSAGEGTDPVAHVAGFAVGAALGALAALPVVRAALDRTPQWLTGAAALGSVAIAWSCALLE